MLEGALVAPLTPSNLQKLRQEANMPLVDGLTSFHAMEKYRQQIFNVTRLVPASLRQDCALRLTLPLTRGEIGCIAPVRALSVFGLGPHFEEVLLVVGWY